MRVYKFNIVKCAGVSINNLHDQQSVVISSMGWSAARMTMAGIMLGLMARAPSLAGVTL